MNNQKQTAMLFLLKARYIWVHGFLLGLMLGVVGIIAYYFILKAPVLRSTGEAASASPATAQLKQPMTSPPAVSPPVSANPAVSLEVQLEQVLHGIKETNQKEDLDRLVSFYSPNFPDLSQRLKSIAKSWKTYDYQKMSFKIHEINLSGEDTAVARVTWDLTTINPVTKGIKNFAKSYQVTFIKESGQWRIIGLKNVS